MFVLSEPFLFAALFKWMSGKHPSSVVSLVRFVLRMFSTVEVPKILISWLLSDVDTLLYFKRSLFTEGSQKLMEYQIGFYLGTFKRFKLCIVA